MRRRAIEVRGVIQGVGFRPFVHALATRLRLRGFVTNHGGRVDLEVEGDHDALVRFERELVASAPPLARIESIVARDVPPRGESAFRIEASRAEPGPAIYIAPDAATCDACLSELFDPANRRYRYPFINCTACGPRLTIITGSPYDRERTTMAAFEMCAACRAEYSDPRDRRFHAEPIACAECGPTLDAVLPDGRSVGGNPIESAARTLAAGGVVAVKGLGGFHLACDAGNAAAVVDLRRRKHRDDKPFAVMAADVAAASAICDVSRAEAELLSSTARPIVLLRKGAAAPGRVGAAVAPANAALGVMLPYTPLHHLLIAAVAGRPLVMTSGNRSDEPIAIDNADAMLRLRDIADLFLVHDREIHVRCDDSVVRHVQGAPLVIRRSRGYAPAPVGLPFECPEPILAVGGQLKNTFALGRGRQAFVSHHVGDLDELPAFEAFERDIALYERAFGVRPQIVAHDLHLDYASTRLAMRMAGATLVGVQHHHAHVASCITEHGVDEPVIGVAWDGAGWGPDGAIWGGEFLIADRYDAHRAAHLRYVALPGGDRAAREPWRMALAHLHDAGIDTSPALAGVPAATRAAVARLIARGVNGPVTSSAGRLFDAVAALCGMAGAMTFEGQAAMWLESLAGESEDDRRYPFALTAPCVSDGPLTVDTRPMIASIDEDRRRGASAPEVARRFHLTLADVIREVAGALRRRTGVAAVALSGGVFLNGLLTSETEARLAGDGFRVYRHRVVSPGDGGLSLGQLAAAAATIARR